MSLLALGCAAHLPAADFDIRNEAEFKKCVPSGAKVEKLASGMGFLEGPQWVPSSGGDYLVFSDIPNNELKKWTAAGGVTTFRQPSHNSNGNSLDRQGRLVTAEHSGRRVSVTEKDGAVKTVVDAFEGRKLNSPNDLAVKSDGTFWFTDPDYGLKNKPGSKDKDGKEQPGNYLYRFDPRSRQIAALVKDFDKPNGICFSPDERRLFVADSGQPKHIRVFDVKSDGTLGGGTVFCQIDNGVPDGIRCDSEGRIWSSAGDGVHIFAPDGSLVGKILVPESPANLCFGGKDLKTLFITARKSLYKIDVTAKGIR